MHSQDIAAPTVGYRMAIRGKARAILGRFAQHMRNRAHARLFIAHAQRVAHIGIGCQGYHSTAQHDPYGGKRGVESQGRPRVSITKFECSFTRAGLGGPWAIPRLYPVPSLATAGVLPQLSGTTQLLPCAYALSYRGKAALACSAVPSLPDIVSICHILRFQIPAQTLLPATEQS